MDILRRPIRGGQVDIPRCYIIGVAQDGAAPRRLGRASKRLGD